MRTWARDPSVWPTGVRLGCCAIQMMAASASHCDIARLGPEVIGAAPRQRGLMIVAGAVTEVEPVLRRLYDR